MAALKALGAIEIDGASSPRLHRRLSVFTPLAGEPRMKIEMALFALAVSLVAAPAVAQSAQPVPVLPESLKWFSPSNNELLKGAWVLGSEKQSGTYVLRVQLAKGGKIAAHTHPDARYSTVLAGTLFVGFGDVANETDVVAVPTGGVYVAPANVAHFLWARDGDVVYQEGGVGPTATVPVKH